MDEQHACLTCDCCKHLPPVPSGSLAQHSLVKQLNLFMELEALLMSNELNENDNNEDDDEDDNDAQMNNYDDTDEHDSFIKQQMNGDNQLKLDDSLVYIDSNINNNNNNNKQDFELIDESEEESPSQSLNKMSGELKLNPLLPSYLYEESPGGQSKLLSMTEPLVGRDWTFKEIEKVILFYP